MHPKNKRIAALPPVVSKGKSNKKGDGSKRKDRNRAPSVKRAEVQLALPASDGEIIRCQLNPFPLTQFLFGYYSRGMVDSDATFSSCVVSNLVFSTLNLYLKDIADLGRFTLPSHIVDIYHSLRPGKIRGKTYTVDLGFLNLFVQNVAANGWGVAGATDVQFPITAGTDFYTCALIPSNLTPAAWRDALAQYGNAFTEVDVTDNSRASADILAYDVAYPSPLDTIVNNFASTPMSFMGTANSINLYARQNSAVALEVPFSKGAWMHQIRACTPLREYSGNNSASDLSRMGTFVVPVDCFPSTLGHQLGSSKRNYRGNVQLKPVPYVAALTDFVTRLETAVKLSGQTSAWQSAFSANEVRLLVYGLFRTAISRYGAHAYGVFLNTSTVSTPTEMMFMSSGYRAFQSVRIPQILNDCLQSQKVYSDDLGVLMPVYGRVSDIGIIPVTLTYSGTNISVLPTDGSNSSYRYFQSAWQLIAKYKAFESGFAGISALTTPTTFGQSMLDVTVSRSSGMNSNPPTTTSNLALLSARRPITQAFQGAVMAKLAYISYDYAQASPITQSQGSAALAGPEDRTKVYRQKYTNVLCGSDVFANVVAATKADGFVPLGAEAANSAGSSSATPMPRLNGQYEGYGYSLMKNVMPWVTYGNYGGPGWTAGSHDSADWIMVDGKYAKSPANGEDAIYKKHDENVFHAGTDVRKQRAADLELYHDLKRYQKVNGLSLFGRTAMAYFAPPSPPKDTL